VAEAIRTALKNYSGTVQSGEESVKIEACRKLNKWEDDERDNDGNVIAHRTGLEYEISYQEE
jgi:hypothetical protein